MSQRSMPDEESHPLRQRSPGQPEHQSRTSRRKEVNSRFQPESNLVSLLGPSSSHNSNLNNSSNSNCRRNSVTKCDFLG